MTALTRNPSNTDLLQSTKFRVTFDKFPGMTFFCTSANIPGISLTEIPYQTSFLDVWVPGEKLIYDTFNITFLVDEEMRAWTELHDWIRGITFPTEFQEFVRLKNMSRENRIPPNSTAKGNAKVGMSDASMTIHTNKNNPNIRFKFVDMFPTSVSTILFNTGDTAENVITADAIFRFAYYNYERLR